LFLNPPKVLALLLWSLQDIEAGWQISGRPSVLRERQKSNGADCGQTHQVRMALASHIAPVSKSMQYAKGVDKAIAQFPQPLPRHLVQAAPEVLANDTAARAAIAAGRVVLDGAVADDATALVYPMTTKSYELDGRMLSPSVPWRMPALYYIDKPIASQCDLTRLRDPITRACAAAGPSFKPVGRLDKGTTGLLLITNDTDLGQIINLPGFLPKTYRVGFNAPSGGEGINKSQRAVITSPCDISRTGKNREKGQNASAVCFSSVSAAREVFQYMNPYRPPGALPYSRYEVDVTISSGMNHIVKRLMSHIGVSVKSLRRIAVGPIRLPGEDSFIPTGGKVPELDVSARTKEDILLEEEQMWESATPELVRIGDQELLELLNDLDFSNFLPRLRRASLIHRLRENAFQGTEDARLTAWLNMTEEEKTRECFHGIDGLGCIHTLHFKPRTGGSFRTLRARKRNKQKHKGGAPVKV